MEWTRSTPLQFATEVLLLLYQESLFTVRSVHQLLWGYRDRLLSTIHVLHPEIDPVFGLFSKVTAWPRLLCFPWPVMAGTAAPACAPVNNTGFVGPCVQTARKMAWFPQ